MSSQDDYVRSAGGVVGVSSPEQLRKLAKEFRHLGTRIAVRVVAAAQPAIESAELGAVATLVSPDGVAWAALKTGGEPSAAIVHRVSVVADGDALRVRLDRVASYHDRGTRGPRAMVARPLLPSGRIPPAWRKALDAASDRAMAAK